MKSESVRVGLHLLPVNSRAKGDGVTAVTVSEGVAVCLALQSDVCMVCNAAQGVSTHYSCTPIYVDEQQEGYIPLESTPLIWSVIPCTNYALVESSLGRVKRG